MNAEQPQQLEAKPKSQPSATDTNSAQAKQAGDVSEKTSASAGDGAASSGHAAEVQACPQEAAKSEDIVTGSVPNLAPEPDQQSSPAAPSPQVAPQERPMENQIGSSKAMGRTNPSGHGSGSADLDVERGTMGESIFDLSALLANVCYRLGKIFHLSRFCVLTECLVVAGAVLRNCVKLRTGLSPHPVNGALHAAFCDDGTGRLARVFEFLFAGVTEIQDAKFMEVTESTRRIIQKRVEQLEKLNAQSEFSPANPDPRIQELERFLNAVILITNPNPGELVSAIRESVDRALTVVLDESAFDQILTTAKTKSADDLRLLRDGWSGTTLRLTDPEHKRAQPIVRPAVTGVIHCGREVLARLLAATEAPLTQIAEQLITMAASEESLADQVSSPRALEDWQTALASLSDLGQGNGVEFVLDLSGDADLVLGEYRDQKLASDASSPEAKRFAKNAPLLAAKIALILQLLVDPGSRQVSGVVMRHAIALAEWLSTTTAGFASTFAADQARAAFIAEAEKMYRKLLGEGRIARWTLFRKYDDQKKDRLEPVLQHLVKTDRVVHYDDDTVEAVEEAGLSYSVDSVDQ
jgi:hypothetical protein